jgi:hypothetical protein
MLKTKQMPKNTKKKLKKTKIIGGKNIAAFTLKDKLELLKINSQNALQFQVAELVKSIDKNIYDKYDINNSILNIKKYLDTYIESRKTFIKYALLCLEDHNKNSYSLLKKKYVTMTIDTGIIFDDTIEKEQELEEKADQYYTLFENFVKNLVENIEKTDTTGKEKTFNDCMYDIYSNGIILLNIGTIDSQHNLKLYIKNSTESSITELTEIVNFFKVKRDCLIIKKYMSDTSNDNYLYDCMLQIINKLARTLLEKLDDSTLDKKGTFSKDALENAVEAHAEAAGAAEEEGEEEARKAAEQQPEEAVAAQVESTAPVEAPVSKASLGATKPLTRNSVVKGVINGAIKGVIKRIL